MLCVCISFPWLKIIQAAFDRDPGPNENTPDMPRRCSIGSVGIGPVAKFLLEPRGNSDHPRAPESNLAPRTARGQANRAPSFSRRVGVPILLPYFSRLQRPALGTARAASEVPDLWGPYFGHLDFRDVKPEY